MKRQEKKFRPEIQGLRAVGALLVAAYHIWFGKVSGGVDVFFVVSGFLVLGPLAERSLDSGRIDLWRYLVGLAKRIVPTAFVVLAAVVVLALVFIPETRWQPLSKQAWASAWFFQNFQLAADSVDYLARDELPSLVQHYWAISAQVHFYLIMGAVVFATGMAARWLRIKTGSILLPALIAIFTGSLAYSIYLTGVNQTVAYFSTSTRLWEFCLGGLLYLALPRIDLGTGARLAAGWVGLVAIVACGAVLPVSSTFPGYTALWPTLAACLVIAAGSGFSRFGADRILTTAPLLNLGAISYGFYLWHWPLLIIYRVVFDVTDVSLVGGLGIMIAAAALATGTYHLVEEPIRRSKIGSQRVLPTFVLGSAFVVPVCALVAGWSLYMKHVRAEERARPLDPAVYQGALAFDAKSQDRSSADVPVRPGKLLARFDQGDLEKKGCHQTLAGTEVIRCVFGNAEASRTIAVVGGSHSGHWLPTLRAMNLETPVRIVTYTKSSCVLSSEHFGNPEYERPCMTWKDNVLAVLIETKPDIVFTTANKSSLDDKSVPEGYLDVWRALEKASIRVAAIRDTPMMGFDVPECVERYGYHATRCTRPSTFAEPDPFPPAEKTPDNVHFLDLSRYFCTSDICPSTAGNVLIYRDMHHLTATYAKTLAPVLQSLIEPILATDNNHLMVSSDSDQRSDW